VQHKKVALLRLGLQRYFVRGPQAGRRNSWGFAAVLAGGARRAGIRAPLTSHTD